MFKKHLKEHLLHQTDREKTRSNFSIIFRLQLIHSKNTAGELWQLRCRERYIIDYIGLL